MSLFDQGKIYPYIDSGRKEYKIRAEAMTKALKETLPSCVKFTEPRGGFYIWLTLPEKADSTEIRKIAIDKGTVFVVGQTFDPDGTQNNAIRISYCITSIDKINKGTKIVSDAIRQVCV